MSELAECREAMREPRPDGQRNIFEWTEELYHYFREPRAEDRIETCPDCGSGIFKDTDGELRCAGCVEIVSLDVELVAPEIVDLSNDPLIMGILAGDIRTLCLDCSERDCPAHPVNGVV